MSDQKYMQSGQYGQPAPYGQQPAPYGHTQQYPMTAPGSTTVVLAQPAPSAVPITAGRDWTSGVCNCCDDMNICLCGWCCGICLAVQVSNDMGESCGVPFCVPGWLTVLRTKMRMMQGIQGTVCSDCLAAECCGPLTLCQLAREIKTCRANGTFGAAPANQVVIHRT